MIAPADDQSMKPVMASKGPNPGRDQCKERSGGHPRPALVGFQTGKYPLTTKIAESYSNSSKIELCIEWIFHSIAQDSYNNLVCWQFYRSFGTSLHCSINMSHYLLAYFRHIVLVMRSSYTVNIACSRRREHLDEMAHMPRDSLPGAQLREQPVIKSMPEEPNLPAPPPLPPPPLLPQPTFDANDPKLDFFSEQFDAKLALATQGLLPPNLRVRPLQMLRQCRFILPPEMDESLADREIHLRPEVSAFICFLLVAQ